MPGPGGGDRFARFLSNDGKVMGGVRRLLNVAQPAAGSEWTATVPGGVMWRMLAGTATLTTSAAVANRQLGFRTLVQSIPLTGNESAITIAASLTRVALYEIGTTINPNAQLTTGIPIPFVPMWLEPGDQFSSSTFNMQAGDQYSAISLLIEEVYYTNQALTEWAEEDQDILETMMGG